MRYASAKGTSTEQMPEFPEATASICYYVVYAKTGGPLMQTVHGQLSKQH